MHILVQNQIVKRSEYGVDIEDRGFQFGDGIYEVIRVYNGNFFALEEHLARLQRSANELRITIPVPMEQIREKLGKLIALEKISDGIVYIQITRGTASRTHYFPEDVQANLVAYASPFPRPLATIENGGKALLVEDIRWLRCDIKSTNLLGNVLAKQAAKEAGALEAILHRGEIVTEGSSSNVFIVKNGALKTHPATHLILNGITRQIVLQIAQELAIPVIEEPFTVSELLNADEVMVTSTTQEITPICAVNDKKIGAGVPGPLAKRLQEALEEKIALIKN